MEYYITLDVGTSSSKIAIIDTECKVIFTSTQSYPTYYPSLGFAEQNPNEWWEAIKKGINICLSESGIERKKILCVGVAGQSWSNIPVNNQGDVLGNNPIWTDTRASDICLETEKKIGKERIFNNSGNPFMPGYQLPKILWLKKHNRRLYDETWQFMSSNGFIVYKFTEQSKMDYSQIYGLHNINIKTAEYDKDLSEEFDIDLSKLPELCETTEIVGKVTNNASQETGIPEGTPVIAGGLDAACSTLGVGVYKSGGVQEQGGQAGGMSIALDNMIAHPSLILSRHAVPGMFLLQGGTVGGGASFEWISKLLAADYDLRFDKKSDYFKYLDDSAADVNPGSDGLIFLPYLAGERSPIWDPNAKGVYFGLDFNKSKGHLIRALLEGVAFALRHNMEIAREVGIEISKYRSTGGSANSSVWTQIKSDVTSSEVEVPDSDEATVKGIAYLCGLAVGVYSNLSDIVDKTIIIKKEYSPDSNNYDIYNKNFEIYKKLYLSLKELMKESN